MEPYLSLCVVFKMVLITCRCSHGYWESHQKKEMGERHRRQISMQMQIIFIKIREFGGG